MEAEPILTRSLSMLIERPPICQDYEIITEIIESNINPIIQEILKDAT